jgi:hypothetical protein
MLPTATTAGTVCPTNLSYAIAPSDAELILSCLAGSAEAYLALVGRYAAKVYDLARTFDLSPLQCGDVCASVWSRAWPELARLKSAEELPALFRELAECEAARRLSHSPDPIRVTGSEQRLILRLRQLRNQFSSASVRVELELNRQQTDIVQYYSFKREKFAV